MHYTYIHTIAIEELDPLILREAEGSDLQQGHL